MGDYNEERYGLQDEEAGASDTVAVLFRLHPVLRCGMKQEGDNFVPPGSTAIMPPLRKK